jgi:hypothetical protein
MTVDDARTALPTQAVPRPRAPQDDAPQDDVEPEERSAGAPLGEFPWPEPWHYSRGARPRSEFWDVATAGWHSRGPVVPPKQDRPPAVTPRGAGAGG